MKVLIDNGHGSNTEHNGKFSPILDGSGLNLNPKFVSSGRFREWKYNRIIARELAIQLKMKGIDAELVVPEDTDISLSERVRRVNTICNRVGADKVILISIHSNACGNGSTWMQAQGWEAYTTKGKTKADIIATCLYKKAKQYLTGHKIREDWTDADIDKEADFYIIKKTKCPAVLTENFFYDNKDDLAYLTSEEGIKKVVQVHLEGILDYISL